MNKNLRNISVVFLIIVILIGSPFLIWYLKDEKYIDVVIIDKTVPDKTNREHKGLMYILNNLKIYDNDLKKPFDYNSDYYGFFPINDSSYTIKDIPKDLKKPDLIYITDTYGVYTDDFYKANQYGTRSKLIYGGTKPEDIEKIKNSLNNNTIIGEFNIFNSPTDSNTRVKMEDIFGIKWKGWIGRYFSDLSYGNEEIPLWLKDNYELENGVEWKFHGPGIVFINSDDKVLVLRKDVELGKDMNKIFFTEKGLNEFSTKNGVNYNYWFEITEPKSNSEVAANFKIDTTEKGNKLLDKYGLKSEFPAIITSTKNYKSYYFAGDFADSNSTPRFYNNSIIYYINKITTLNEDANQNYFYWNVYYPMIESIFNKLAK